jgi:hypothetical protein
MSCTHRTTITEWTCICFISLNLETVSFYSYLFNSGKHLKVLTTCLWDMRLSEINYHLFIWSGMFNYIECLFKLLIANLNKSTKILTWTCSMHTAKNLISEAHEFLNKYRTRPVCWNRKWSASATSIKPGQPAEIDRDQPLPPVKRAKSAWWNRK